MKERVLFHAGHRPVYLHEDGTVTFTGEFTVNADGSPFCYHPKGSPPGLDYLANGGRPGRWWGVATDNGRTTGNPLIQGSGDPAPGFYVSTTAYKNPGYRNGDTRRELDSGNVIFFVAPRQLIKIVAPVVLGCLCVCENLDTGKKVIGGIGDIGPANHLGEGSMAAARAMGLSDNPKHGGSSKWRFKYTITPGHTAPGFILQPASGRRGAARIGEAAIKYQLDEP